MQASRWIVILISALVVLLALTAGLAVAQEGGPPPERQPLDPDAPEFSSAYIPIQGRLTDAGGQPLNGTYNVIFSIYGQYTGGAPLCQSVKSLDVEDGLFATYISGISCSIDGRMLYLGIKVGSDVEMTPRQYIDNVPYAWGLRPGAVISGSLESGAIVHIENWGVGGRGLRSYAMATSGVNYGVVGASRSPDGYGAYFYNTGGGAGVRTEGLDSGADLILGGNANTSVGDDGILVSDPAFASSDIILRSNDTVRIDLDDDADGEDADFEIHDSTGATIFNVDESGTVTSGGAGIAAFPRPAYDSGLVSVSAGNTVNLTHSLGSNIDNYVVDLTCQHAVYGRHIWGLGGDVTAGGFYGVFWKSLTTSAISVERATNDGQCPQVRVRIWLYP
jgi:hypothetical protein